MCTLSVLPRPGGYRLAMNRDEAWTRPRATELFASAGPGLARAYPVDALAGGTWIGMNQAGLCLALLNQYPAVPDAPHARSRGLLIPSLLDAASAEQAAGALAELDLEAHRPFLMLAVDRQGPLRLCRWLGGRREAWSLERAPLLLSSSGREPERVVPGRQAQFQAWLAQGPGPAATLEELRRFHASHQPTRGLLSVCAHREDAGTVSLSLAQSGEDGCRLVYAPGSPCQADPAAEKTWSLPA